jgi:hypothetical protein
MSWSKRRPSTSPRTFSAKVDSGSTLLSYCHRAGLGDGAGPLLAGTSSFRSGPTLSRRSGGLFLSALAKPLASPGMDVCVSGCHPIAGNSDSPAGFL